MDNSDQSPDQSDLIVYKRWPIRWVAYAMQSIIIYILIVYESDLIDGVTEYNLKNFESSILIPVIGIKLKSFTFIYIMIGLSFAIMTFGQDTSKLTEEARLRKEREKAEKAKNGDIGEQLSHAFFEGLSRALTPKPEMKFAIKVVTWLCLIVVWPVFFIFIFGLMLIIILAMVYSGESSEKIQGHRGLVVAKLLIMFIPYGIFYALKVPIILFISITIFDVFGLYTYHEFIV